MNGIRWEIQLPCNSYHLLIYLSHEAGGDQAYPRCYGNTCCMTVAQKKGCGTVGLHSGQASLIALHRSIVPSTLPTCWSTVH